ncbi:unnamed protein product [uncultured bacterium]|nr:unnamed protein product [uncultured bacterium]
MARAKILIPGRTEHQVLAQVLEALRAWGIDPVRRNTGAATNPSGRLVMFGRKGDSDIQTIIPAGWTTPDGRDISGKVLQIEVKREGFVPAKARGKERERFRLQVAKLKQTCADGGYGFWANDAIQAVRAIQLIRLGWRVEWDDDLPSMTDEEVGRESDLRADAT